MTKTKYIFWNKGKKKVFIHGLGDKHLKRYGQDVKVK